MSPLVQLTDVDHGGEVFEEDTDGHVGSPERLPASVKIEHDICNGISYLMEVTSHPLATADLHIRDPRKPFPPATTSRFFTACAMVDSISLFIWILRTSKAFFSTPCHSR